MTQFKSGVVFWNMHDSILLNLNLIDAIHKRIALRDAIITSARDGEHSTNSKHYEGKAIDLRTRDLPSAMVDEIVADLKQALGSAWDIIDEDSHIHCEWDPK
jgi:hypothetical protein